MSKQADNQNNELNGMLYVQSNYLDEWEEAIDFHKELYNEALKYGEDGYLTNHIITRDKVFEQSGYIYCVVATVGFNKVFFVNKTIIKTFFPKFLCGFFVMLICSTNKMHIARDI